MGVFARADVQSISGVPGCDESHIRPLDPRTGAPVSVWELNCPAHEAWICGDGKPKVLMWDRSEGGGFQQRRVAQMDPCWARSVEAIPLTQDQVMAESRRNSLTRRAEQAMLAEGIRNTRLAALEGRPTAKELIRARALSGRGTVQMGVCHSCQSTYSIGAIYCPMCAVRVTPPAEADAAAPAPEVALESQEA